MTYARTYIRGRRVTDLRRNFTDSSTHTPGLSENSGVKSENHVHADQRRRRTRDGQRIKRPSFAPTIAAEFFPCTYSRWAITIFVYHVRSIIGEGRHERRGPIRSTYDRPRASTSSKVHFSFLFGRANDGFHSATVRCHDAFAVDEDRFAEQ